MTNTFAEQRKIDLVRQLGELEAEEGRLAVKVQEADALIKKGPARVAAAIKGAHESEVVVVAMHERDKAAAEKKLAEWRQIREGVEAELQHVVELLDFKAKGKSNGKS